MADSPQDLLRAIPSVDAVLHEAAADRGLAEVPHRLLVESIREAIDETRKALLTQPADQVDAETVRGRLLADVRRRVRSAMDPHYRKVINATGTVLHTALGRAVLPARALRQIEQELSGYSLLQADITTGRRARRDARIQWLLQQLTGAEAATVVNNNAAATAIVLNTVAKGKEVIVSRGQLVEIGGSFRLHEVLAASGAKLVEVGATNRTHPADYERAITDSTAAILRVHPSNYKITGFTAEVRLDKLVEIAHGRGLLLIDDVGAGPLVDVARFGFQPEPTLPDSVRAGADLITASADKLIGGPQGGIILGRVALIQAIRSNPLARIVRVDKVTLAALEATLTLFLDESLALGEVPTLRMLSRKLPELAAQAERIAERVRRGAAGASVAVIEGSSQVGSGSLPTQNLPTRLVAVAHPSLGPDELALRLRRHHPPVFTRIHDDQVLIDPRTLLDGEEEVLVAALVEALR
jgi:L-seryl-tRNA(Ser) seleniumtransferase